MSYLLAQASAHALPLADESVQCVVTSPPYWGLREYDGEQEIPGWGALGLEPTPELYVEHMVAIMREVWRVLRPDGTLWLSLGDSYAGSWGAQSRANGNDMGSTLEDGSMLSARQISEHPKGTHTGSLKNTPGLKAKDLIGIPWRVALALQADGWWLRSDIVWSKPNPMPESVTDRPTKAHEYIFLLTKSARYFYDAPAVREADGGRPSGNHARKFRADHGGNQQLPNAHQGFAVPWEPDGTGRNMRTVWEIATQPYPGAHFATFPRELAERCIKAGSAPDDVVLDPFNGSGTTGRASVALQRCYVGLDLSRGYLGQALERVDPIAATAKAGEQGVLL